jgi:hypothetical protein
MTYWFNEQRGESNDEGRGQEQSGDRPGSRLEFVITEIWAVGLHPVLLVI